MYVLNFSNRLAMMSILTFKFWETRLIANLTKRVTKLPFTSIETLVIDSDYKLGTAPGSAQMDFLQYSSNPIHKLAWKERMEPNMDAYEGFLEGNY